MFHQTHANSVFAQSTITDSTPTNFHTTSAQEYFFQPATAVTLPLTDEFTYGSIACSHTIFDLLQAFKKVHQLNPTTRLEIICDDELATHITLWLTTHLLQDVVLLHPWQADTANIMLHWHALVVTAIHTELPCPIIEARLLKLPVLAYELDDIHDIIRDGVNGLLFPHKAWQQLAQGMLWISENNYLFQYLRIGNDSLQNFDFEEFLEQQNH